jgi:aminoglycoside 3-N-acetyltransferase
MQPSRSLHHGAFHSGKSQIIIRRQVCGLHPDGYKQKVTQLSFDDFYTALKKLELDRHPVIAHASLSAFGQVAGGAETVVGGLAATCETLIMPAFTYKSMVIPEVGPLGNAIEYGSGIYTNRMAEFFRPNMPVDRLIGSIPEAVRRSPNAERSSHPILSFTGFNAQRFLSAQTIAEPLAPIRRLHEAGGWVLLLGVNFCVNTSIHYAELLAGRKQFLRWALTPKGVVACPGYPGCSDGFDALQPDLRLVTRRVQVRSTQIQALPLADLIQAACQHIAADPYALLCSRPGCERCNAARAEIGKTERRMVIR